MKLGSIAGLTGLSKSVDYVAQNQREFAQMENVEKGIQADKQASMVAQELESKQYEEISAKAAELLEPDRIKIKNKSLELQRNIRDKIEEYGSRKAFFENGGIALLSQYKSDVLNSPETLSYTDNKKNMESIMKVMADNKGHLLSDMDKQNLDNYNAGIGDGKITYGGMKSEVTIPEKYYNYGQEVPAPVILASNRMQIYNNWLMDNPKMNGLTGPQLEDELLNYTIQNHYGQGTNMMKYQHDLSQQEYDKQAKAVKAAGTKEEDEIPISYVAASNEVLNQVQSSSDPATISKLMEPVNFIQKTAINNRELSGVMGNINPYVAADTNYNDDNLLGGLWGAVKRTTGMNEKYTPASAIHVKVGNLKGVVENLYPGSTSANDIAIPLTNGMIYSPNGNLLPSDVAQSMVKAGADKGGQFGGLITAYVDDKNNMVTQVRDSNGKSLGKTDKNGKYQLTQEERDHMAGYSGNLRHEMFAVITTADGHKYYQRLDANDIKGESDLALAIGDYDNVTTAVKRRQKSSELKAHNEISKQYNAKVTKQYAAIASGPNGVFSTPEFKADAKSTRVGDGSDRYKAVKSYYMALSYLTEGNGRNKGTFNPNLMLSDGYYKKGNPNNFTNAVNYHPEIKKALISKSKYSDTDFIKLMGDITAGDNPEDIAANQEVTATWLKFYNLLNSK
jgi:hypothetical protein